MIANISWINSSTEKPAPAACKGITPGACKGNGDGECKSCLAAAIFAQEDLRFAELVDMWAKSFRGDVGKANGQHVADVLTKTLPEAALEAAASSGKLFTGFKSLEDAIATFVLPLQHLLQLDPYVAKSDLASGFLRLNNAKGGQLASGSVRDQVHWARTEAAQVKSMLLLSCRTAKRSVTGEKLSAALRQLVLFLQQRTTSGSASSVGSAVAMSRGDVVLAEPRAAAPPELSQEVSALYGIKPRQVQGLGGSAILLSDEEEQEDEEVDEMAEGEGEEDDDDFTEGAATAAVAPSTPKGRELVVIPSSPPDPPTTFLWSPSVGCLLRHKPGAAVVASTMSHGPRGFWMASFEDGLAMETEWPNMLPCGPPEAPVLKRPAAALAASEAEGEGQVDHQQAVPEAPKSKKTKTTSPTEVSELKGKLQVVQRNSPIEKAEAYILCAKSYVVGLKANRAGAYMSIIRQIRDEIEAGKITTKDGARSRKEQLVMGQET